MPLKQKRSRKNDSKGLEKLLIIIVSQYAILFSSGLASAAAIFLVFNPLSPFFMASNIAVLAAAGLSAAYLLLHQCGAWKHSLEEEKTPLENLDAHLAWSKAVNILAVLVWIAATVLGLIMILNSPFCIKSLAITEYGQGWSLKNCKAQQGGFITTLVSMMFSLVLFCMLASAKQPFAASLAGIYDRDRNEEVILCLSTASWPDPIVPEVRPTGPLLGTNIYTRSCRTLPALQALSPPKPSFLSPTQQGNSIQYTSPVGVQSLKHKESNLLPSPPIVQDPQKRSSFKGERSGTPLKRSATTFTFSSSIYSQQNETTSSLGRSASTSSSISDHLSFCPSNSSPPPPIKPLSWRPSVPRIPQHYLPSPITTPNDEPLTRSHTQSPMPLAKVWDSSQPGQQSYNHFMEQTTPMMTALARPRRHTDCLHDNSLHGTCPSRVRSPGEERPLYPTFTRNNGINADQAIQRSHENSWKGRSVDSSTPKTWI